MNISAINTAVKANATFGSAKTNEIELEIQRLQGKEPNEIVDYGTWGDNYPVPITVGQQLASLQAELAREKAKDAYKPQEESEPDWYKAQRFNSPEYVG